MIVTDKQYHMEPRLIEKLDIMIQRSTKKNFDNLLIIDGDEGYGKSTLALAIAYYVHHKTGRPFDIDNVFFKVEEMIKFAVNNSDQIIIWDEAALGGLTTQWQHKTQQKLIQMVMTARKKKHFYIFCIPKFHRLTEYLILDRSIALLHVYAINEIELGRFTYYKKKSKEWLYYMWRKNREKGYMKYKTFRGTFPNVSREKYGIIDMEKYEAKKDEAIKSILEVSNNNVWRERYDHMRYLYATLEKADMKNKAIHAKTTERTIYRWAKQGQASFDG